MKTFFISTAIPYVNADPHIGFALELVQADAVARAHRGKGESVFFLTGTDDNALKNVQAAEKAGKDMREWVAARAEIFKNLAKKLQISNDDFIRTSVEERHIEGARKLWQAAKPDIYKKKYRGWYCVGCESFKTEKELANGECPEHPGRKLEEVEEENYFFRLSRFSDKLARLIESGTLKVVPESRKHEILNFIKSGLEDFSISRSRGRAKEWGIEVPHDPSQLIYVWFDALSNYISALGYAENGDNFKKFWQSGDEIVHVIGKDINRFHTVYWPAMLLSAGLRLPSAVFVHGFITINGQKMSKTLGNVVSPFELIEKYGADALRYYLLREIPAYEDGDFSYEKFEARYNADLANGLGNFGARVLALANNSEFEIHANKSELSIIEEEIENKIKKTRLDVDEKLREFKFNEALAAIWDLIAFGDAYVNQEKPWDKQKRADVKHKTILNLVIILDNVAALIQPFLPETSKKISDCIKWEDGKLQVKKISPLFPRLN